MASPDSNASETRSSSAFSLADLTGDTSFDESSIKVVHTAQAHAPIANVGAYNIADAAGGQTAKADSNEVRAIEHMERELTRRAGRGRR